MSLLPCLLPLLVGLSAPVVRAAAHYTGYEHGPGVESASVGLDVILGVEEADSGDRGADFHQYLNSLAHRPRPMVPFQWYPYAPADGHGAAGGAGGGSYYKPSRWPEEQGVGGGAGAALRPAGAHKPTVLYLEGDDVAGVEGRPNRPGLLSDPQAGPDRPDHPDFPDRPDIPDRPTNRPDRPHRPPNRPPNRRLRSARRSSANTPRRP